jgi:hypothetical protein
LPRSAAFSGYFPRVTRLVAFRWLIMRKEDYAVADVVRSYSDPFRLIVSIGTILRLGSRTAAPEPLRRGTEKSKRDCAKSRRKSTPQISVDEARRLGT